MELVMAAATDCGSVRKVNEDFFYYSKKKNLVILCDGMGGHNAGATASRIAGETVRDALLHPDLAELIRLGQDIKDRLPVLALRMVIGARLANRRLRMMAEQDRNLRGMGTTLVAMAFSENTVCAAHIGDSRIYSLQENKLQQLTDDHSWVNELLQDHEIREDEVKHFRKKNVLTRALGTHPCVKVDVQWFPLNAPNTFLLCSDGLHNALDSEKIVQALGNDDDALLQKSVQRLIQKAKSVDGSDNITAAVVRARKVTSHHAQWHHEKITVPEEPEPSFAAEDRFIKSKYYGKPSRKIWANQLGKIGWLAILVSVLGVTVAAFSLIRSHYAPTKPRVISAQAQAESRTEAQKPATSAQAGKNGTGGVVLLQVDENEQLEDVKRMKGARVLHTFESAKDGSQIRPGYYSLVLVDSLDKIVYRKDKIHLQWPLPLRAVSDRSASFLGGAQPRSETPANSGAQFAASIDSRRDSAQLPAHNGGWQSGGKIFLPGLNRQQYEGAQIFANDALIGPARQLADAGFFLRSGSYTIAVKDSTGRILHQRHNIAVSRGDVKPLEFVSEQ